VGTSGLVISAGSSTVRGLAINRFNNGGFTDSGITLQTGGGNTIAGNFLGTDPSGTIGRPNRSGLSILDSPNNVIGGTTVGARNLVSSNIIEQIFIDGNGATGNQVQGNYVGTNAAGSGSLMTLAGNRAEGIWLHAPSNTIGGTAAGAGNLLSGNANTGVFINAVNGNTVQGNLVGTDGNGTAANSNGIGNIDGVGAIDTGGGSNNVIGGTVPGSRNVIAGNGGPGIEVGILLQGTGNTVIGNFIGVDVTGNNALGNNGPGVLTQGGSNNSVGGTPAGAGNKIAFNKGGVEIRGTGTGNAVLGNSVYSNSPGLGIDIYTGFTPNGVTANDACDADTGPNNFQNFPVLTSAAVAGGNVTLSGTLNSTASTTFRVEFFSNTACHASGNGEGRTFLGFASVTTDGSCNVAFGPLVFAVPAGETVFTATASDPTNSTSEFSACLAALVGPTSTPTNTPTSTPTSTPTLTNTPAGVPTATPTPTNTPALTATPTVTQAGPAAVVPTLSGGMLLLLGAALALISLILVRRN
jgi:titin